MKKGFTLIELLVTVGIMGMLATLAVSGYFAGVRGMADRGAMTDTATIINLAAQRTYTDNVRTAVFFYNQKISDSTVDEDIGNLYVGTVVALRQAGRITAKVGSVIGDEFADWQTYYSTNSNNSSDKAPRRIYQIEGNSIKYSLVSEYLDDYTINEDLATYGNQITTSDGYTFWGLKVVGGNATWDKVGQPYWEEIGSLTLPRGYVFGQSTSGSIGDIDILSTVKIFSPYDSSQSMPSITIYASAPGAHSSMRKVGEPGARDNNTLDDRRN